MLNPIIYSRYKMSLAQLTVVEVYQLVLCVILFTRVIHLDLNQLIRLWVEDF
jgi:hypothetical protein